MDKLKLPEYVINLLDKGYRCERAKPRFARIPSFMREQIPGGYIWRPEAKVLWENGVLRWTGKGDAFISTTLARADWDQYLAFLNSRPIYKDKFVFKTLGDDPIILIIHSPAF